MKCVNVYFPCSGDCNAQQGFKKVLFADTPRVNWVRSKKRDIDKQRIIVKFTLFLPFYIILFEDFYFLLFVFCLSLYKNVSIDREI